MRNQLANLIGRFRRIRGLPAEKSTADGTRTFARSPGGYWIGAIIFGAIFPDVISWFVVAPLKGLPVGYGFHFPGLLVGPIVNGLWGLGMAVILNGRLSIEPVVALILPAIGLPS
jgi:hypothetical protein